MSCAAGSSLCGTNCVDTSNDVRNCGACGNVCATGARADAVCTAGRCAPRCTEGFADCNGSATDGCEADLSAPESCGACSVRCASGAPLCVTSGTVRACGSGCAPAETRCGMTCVDTTRDPTDCGGCGVTCPTCANATATCASGTCGIRCSAGFADCDGNATNGCEADLSVATTCGACGARCAAATPLCAASGSTFACVSGCAPGQSRCDAGCADLQTSVTDCGTCGNACPPASNAMRTCASGRCGFTCAPGFADCNGSAADGCEADLSSPSTCGTCARACAGATPVCVGSGSTAVCGSGCPAGQARCAGSCVDVQTDSGNCGSCGMICPMRANATVSCRAATCVSTCSTGYGDCDRNAANGCEASLLNDPFNCGGCGTLCSTGFCAAGVCTVPRNCDELHTALPTTPSGRYVIDPDGTGGNPSFTVFCDMATDGGGWTVIHSLDPTTSTGASGSVPYSINDATLRAISTRFLVSWRDASNASLPGWTRFGMFPSWRAASPFGALYTDETVSISIEGATPRYSLLRYGLRGWSATAGGLCTFDWDNGFNRGRICFTDTTAPYYSGWSIGDGNYCAASNGAYNALRCAADRRFTLAVR